MKQIVIDRLELSAAFYSSFPEMNHYLDTEVGQVLVVTDESRRQLASITAEYDDPDAPDNFDLEAVLAEIDLQDQYLRTFTKRIKKRIRFK